MVDHFELHGAVWNSVRGLNDNLGALGFIIIGIFVASWVVSITVYRLKRYDEIKPGPLSVKN
jgi:high-affinity nickel-transport protein